MTITQEFVSTIEQLIDMGVCSGLGQPRYGEMCVEHLIAYVEGTAQSDQPRCVDSIVRSITIVINDSPIWSDNYTRAAGLKRLAIAQLGTSIEFDTPAFVRKFIRIAANYLRTVVLSDTEDPYHDQLLHTLPTTFDTVSDNMVWMALLNLKQLLQTMYGAANSTQRGRLGNLIYCATNLYLAHPDRNGTIHYGDSIISGAYGIVRALEHMPNEESSLASLVEEVVQVLIHMKTPGSAFLKGDTN